MSKRKDLLDYLLEQLKCINGGRSSFGDQSYIYNTDLHGLVSRQLKTFDEENAFPSIYLIAGRESRFYSEAGLTEGLLDIKITGYIHDEETRKTCDDLIRDIEHVIYNVGNKAQLGLQDLVVQTILTDDGLLQPYGIIEILLLMSYQIIK